MSLDQVLDLLNRGGVLVLLVLLLVGGWRQWWVYGPQHRENLKQCQDERDRVLKERDQLLALALNATVQAKTSLDLHAGKDT